MNDDKLQRLDALLELVDTKSTAEEFVSVFTQVVEFLAQNEEQLVGDIATIFARLDEIAAGIEADSKTNNNNIRGLVSTALMDLRSSIDARLTKGEQSLAVKLSTIKDGYSPIKGKDYFDGEPGKTPVAGVDFPIPKDGSPDTPDQVVEKVNTSSFLIKKERVEGLVDLMRNMATQVAGAVGITTTIFFKNGTQIGRAKNINFTGSGVSSVTVGGDTATVNISGGGSGGQVNSVVAGTGISVDSTDPANPIVSATASSFVGSQEKTTTPIDGVQTTFAFTHTPRIIVWNGAIQTLTDDYTVSSLNITFTASAGVPQIGDTIINIYA